MSLNSPENRAYHAAKQRCNNPKSNSYSDYGARGIEFRFNSYKEFLADIGPKPSAKHQLDRKNNNGHYEVGNVRWVTRDVQMGNRRAWAKGAKYKGVFRVPSGRFHAHININHKRICAPVVTTELQAAKDYDALVVAHKLDRTLNFPFMQEVAA
jgi:hypothetical protein